MAYPPPRRRIAPPGSGAPQFAMPQGGGNANSPLAPRGSTATSEGGPQQQGGGVGMGGLLGPALIGKTAMGGTSAGYASPSGYSYTAAEMAPQSAAFEGGSVAGAGQVAPAGETLSASPVGGGTPIYTAYSPNMAAGASTAAPGTAYPMNGGGYVINSPFAAEPTMGGFSGAGEAFGPTMGELGLGGAEMGGATAGAEAGATAAATDAAATAAAAEAASAAPVMAAEGAALGAGGEGAAAAGLLAPEFVLPALAAGGLLAYFGGNNGWFD